MNMKFPYYSPDSFFEDFNSDDSGYLILNLYIPENITVPSFMNADKKWNSFTYNTGIIPKWRQLINIIRKLQQFEE